jgi:hypothetical protein
VPGITPRPLAPAAAPAGGTDVDYPLALSIDRLGREEWSQADILMVRCRGAALLGRCAAGALRCWGAVAAGARPAPSPCRRVPPSRIWRAALAAPRLLPGCRALPARLLQRLPARLPACLPTPTPALRR